MIDRGATAAGEDAAPRLADRLFYFAPAHQGFPGKAANNIQMMKVCLALGAAGQPTTLVVPRRPDTAARLARAGDLARMYGLAGAVDIEWCGFPYPYAALQQGLYAPLAAVRAYRRRVRAAYTRHEWTAVALAALGIPIICEIHHFRVTAALRMLFRRAARGRPIVFVCISAALAALLVEAGCPATALLAAHDGVDLERFTPAVDRREARARLGLPDRPIACHAGHLYPGRGIETVIASARRMPGVLFLFAGGTAADVARHRTTVAAAGLSNVRFVGDVANAELPLYLFAADALLMPYTSGTATHRYMSPMKLFEYLAAGRPIIASDFAVLHEVLTPDAEAIFVPAADPDSLCAALDRVLADPAAAARMGEAARRTAADHSWIERQRRILRFAAGRFAECRRGVRA